MPLLLVNAGSSTLKFSVIPATDSTDAQVLFHGVVQTQGLPRRGRSAASHGRILVIATRDDLIVARAAKSCLTETL